jgi:hypothetical protein
VKFFEKTKLPPDVLGQVGPPPSFQRCGDVRLIGNQIWQIADKENRGLLTPSGFGVVLRLIGHAQAGRPPSAELATQGNTPNRARPVSNLTNCAQLALCHDSMDNRYRQSPPRPLGHLRARRKQGLLQFESLLSPLKRLTNTHCCLRSQG